MRESMKNKEGIPIKCKYCGYTWKTKSLRPYVSCPWCMNKNKVPHQSIV